MKEVENWIHKSEHDLASAKKLIWGEAPINDTAIYHTQQCAEKIIKAFLCYKQIEIPKTHDVELLIELATENDASFIELTYYAECLTPYATAFRYPGIDFEPEIQEVEEAIRMAEFILKFTNNKIKSNS